MLLKMPTEDEEETRDKWVDRLATVIRVEDDRYLMHSNVRATDVSTQWFLATHIRKAPQAFSYNMPRHGGLHQDDRSTARQVGPIVDRGVLESGIYDTHIHKVWMCYLIYAHLPLNAQQLDKTLLPMFLGKLADLAL